jgi:hypothetical protein
MLVAMVIVEATTVEWVKIARRAEREATLGGWRCPGTKIESSATTTVLSPGQEAPPVDPAARPLPPMLSANVDGVPQ